ncbi:MAG: GNAT family N-acetyltransferase [Candidatus Obscuribacterales bacterium]|nr:GNAT family N-acetyltransferase [Candidatus Obscuribacterales bacterium]
MQLETERLFLRHWQESDVEPFCAITSDPEVRRYYPNVLSASETKTLVVRIKAHFEKENFGLWSVELKSTGEFIGYTGLQKPTIEAHFMPCVEIGWTIAKKHWGNGYAPEAAAKALEDGFTRIGLDEIVSFTTVSNDKSIRVMEKLGMTRNPKDDYSHPLLPQGHPLKPHVLFRLSKSEWLIRQRL